MRLIDADAMRQDWLENGENEFVYDTNSVLSSIDEQATIDAVEEEKVAAMLRDMYGDDCACNYNGNDEWLCRVCKYADTDCPYPKEQNGCWLELVRHWEERNENETQ